MFRYEVLAHCEMFLREVRREIPSTEALVDRVVEALENGLRLGRETA